MSKVEVVPVWAVAQAFREGANHVRGQVSEIMEMEGLSLSERLLLEDVLAPLFEGKEVLQEEKKKMNYVIDTWCYDESEVG